MVMLFIDIAIMCCIVLKLIIVSVWAIVKRDKDIIYRYCYPFEVFLILLFAHSAFILNILQAVVHKLQKLNKKVPSPIGANVQHVQVLEANLGALMDQFLMFTLLVGGFIVHYSRHYPITYKSILPIATKDHRKLQLEAKGLLLALKAPFVFKSVLLIDC